MQWMVFLMQNKRKTDNRKTTITFSSDDFSAPGEGRICKFYYQHAKAYFTDL